MPPKTRNKQRRRQASLQSQQKKRRLSDAQRSRKQETDRVRRHEKKIAESLQKDKIDSQANYIKLLKKENMRLQTKLTATQAELEEKQQIIDSFSDRSSSAAELELEEATKDDRWSEKGVEKKYNEARAVEKRFKLRTGVSTAQFDELLPIFEKEEEQLTFAGI